MGKLQEFLKKKYKFLIAFVIIFSSALVLWLILQPSKPKKPEQLKQGDYSYAIDYADYLVRKEMKKNKIPGLVIALLDDQDVIYSQAYGYANSETKEKTTLDTVFKVGSISKVFTGIEVMRLQEEGLIDIRNPLDQYLPEFQINDRFSDSVPISVQSVLSHRSGLPRGGTILGWAWEYNPHVLRELTTSLSESYMVYPTNYRYKYSNIGYNVLARMIEVVRGLEPPSEESAGAYPYHMKENIFDPLGMNDTGFGSNELLYGVPSSRPVAMGYYREKRKNIPYNQFDIIHLASGNVHSTLNDMIKFTSDLLNPEDSPILSQALLDKMFEPQSTGSEDLKTTGLTWFMDTDYFNELVVFHSGTNQGFISMMALIPGQKLGLVVMANSDEFENARNTMVFDILNILLESKTGVTKPAKPKEEVISVSRDILETYQGKYLINDELIKIFMKNGQLKAGYKGFNIKLHAVDNNRFIFKNPLFPALDSGIRFYPGGLYEEDYMIIDMVETFFCPRYPVAEDTPPFWNELIGEYTKYARHPSPYSDEETMGESEIYVSDGILMLSGVFGLLPVEDNRILIQGGVFHGETMEYDPATGNITWQQLIYKPKE